MSDHLREASIYALRGWELGCVLWALAVVAVLLRQRARPLLWGVMAGTLVGATLFDFLTSTFFPLRIVFDERSLRLLEFHGAPWTVWAPLSYSGYFALQALLVLRYRDALGERLGNWVFLVLPVGFGLLDIPIEGLADALKVQRYQWDSLLVLGVPITNVVFIALVDVLVLKALFSLDDLMDLRGRRSAEPAHRPSMSRSSEFLLGSLLLPGSLVLGMAPVAWLLVLVDPFST